MIKMKILRVINSLNIGGAERSIVGNLPLHIKNGYDMDVLLLNGENTFFKEELRKQNINVISLGKSKFLFNPLFLFKIIRLIDNYNIVHVHLFPSLYWVALAKYFKNSKTKLVFTEHNTLNKRRGSVIFKWMDRFIYKFYDRIIAITPEANANLKLHLKYDINITTIYNGVDIEKIKDGQNEDVLFFNDFNFENKKIIVQIASFRNQKDQDTLIRAMVLLPNEFHVFFVGDGDRIKICKDLAKKKGVEDRVSFLGLQKNVGAILARANIVVMSSHYEGFGRAAIEGMAIGMPVIASNVPGLSNLVNGAGLLFEVGDEEMLSSLILKLANNSDLYNEVSKKCSIRAREYGIEKMVKGYELLYDKLFCL